MAKDELQSAKVYQRANGVEVQLKIPDERFQGLASKGRNLTGRTGCGLCGASSARLMQPSPVTANDRSLTHVEHNCHTKLQSYA